MKNFLQSLLTDGGPMIYVISFLLLIALIIFAERFIFLHRARIDTYELLHGLTLQLNHGNVKEAIVNCDVRTGPIGEVIRVAIENWANGEIGIRNAVEENVRLQIPHLERNMKLLTTLSNLAPVLGFLGTLFAIMKLFSIIGDTGSGQFTGMAQLIGDTSKALICTATGVVVSVISQIFHAVLVEKIDFLLSEMGKAASEITYYLATHKPPQEL